MKFKKKTSKKHKKPAQNHDIIDDSIDLIDSGIKKIKNKISLFYKIHFCLAVFISFLLFYFLVIVSLDPISVPFLSDKINSFLRDNYDKSAKIDDAKIDFTSYGSIKILANNFRSDKLDKKDDNIDIKIPQIEAEFSIFKLFILQYAPNKLIIRDPEILLKIDDVDRENIKVNVNPREDYENYVKIFAKSIAALQKRKDYSKNIEIENLSFKVLKNDVELDFLLRESKIRIDNKGFHRFYFSASNVISIGDSENNIMLSNDCVIDQDDSIKCDILANNFNLNDFKNLGNDFEEFKDFNINLSSKISFMVKDKFEYFNFEADSVNGDFYISKMFRNRMKYENLSIYGDYDFDRDNFVISSVNADLEPLSDNNESQLFSPDIKHKAKKTKIKISYIVKGFLNRNFKNSILNISLKDVDLANLDDFWPLDLKGGKKSRKWVIKHVKAGYASDANLRIEKVKNGVNSYTKSLDSKIYFDNMSVDYSERFPNIHKASGIAVFDKNSMNIIINEGEILESKLSNSIIRINDFKKPILDIEANISGNSSDPFKHINYSSNKFVNSVERYINGSSSNFLELKIPLTKDVNLKNIYLAVDMDVKNVKTKYIDGDLKISAVKDFNKSIFYSDVRFDDAFIHFNSLSIKKNVDVESSMKLKINASSSEFLFIDDIVLKSKIGNRIKYAKADLKYSYQDKNFNYINIRNKFGINDYRIILKADNNNKYDVKISGKRIDLREFFEKKDKINSDLKYNFANLNMIMSFNKIYLANKHSFKNVNMNLKCRNKICFSGNLIANDNKNKNLLNLLISKNNRTKKYDIKGSLSDVGYFSESFNVSSQIDGGLAKINIEQDKESDNIVYNGKIKINNEIIFYESSITKKLEKDGLYLKVKDKIFSNKRTKFNKVDLDFKYKNKIFNINSFIANNYKIGITAKGYYDMALNSYDFKGMIIPGFIINNLFGIGKIPVIGNVIGLLTGGQKDGGVFGIKYQYSKLPNQKEAVFKTNTISSFVPVSIRNLFDKL